MSAKNTLVHRSGYFALLGCIVPKNIICVVLLIATGCTAQTKPNISMIHQIPAIKSKFSPHLAEHKIIAKPTLKIASLFEELSKLDYSIALEAGRLPEFQEEPGEPQTQALVNFIDLIKGLTPDEKNGLDRLMKIGRPEIRRYSAPLQAILWALERGEYNPKDGFLDCDQKSSQVCLQGLLDKSWHFTEENRWKDYNMVTDRLNSPELIDYYEKRRFIYIFRADHIGNSRTIFKTNKGQCADVTAFTVDCLKKGGYKAWDHHVASPNGYSYHHVTRFLLDGKYYIMDNGRPDKRGIVPIGIYSPY